MTPCVSQPRPVSRLFLALPLALSALCAAAFGQQTSQYDAYPPSVGGQEAIEALGDRIDALAAEAGLPVAELEQLFLTDESMRLSDSGRLFFVDTEFVPAGNSPHEDDTASFRLGPSIPSSQAFLLHSRPGSNYTIYLDFDGHHSVNNDWNHNIVFPAYNTAGSSASFSNGELQQIIAHWRHVAEDYAPFDVDVTTEEPPAGALVRSNGGDDVFGVRDIHTQATSGFGNGIGGVAMFNSFNDNVDNPVFSFNKGNNAGGMTGSHEVGHSFGLVHDGLNGNSYHPGISTANGTWGPIMGAPFSSSTVHWSDGNYAGATNSQNDINEITDGTHGVTLLDDDHPDTLGTGAFLNGACPDPANASVCGLIRRRQDVDAFRFTTPGGSTTVTGLPAAVYPNLNIVLELYDDQGSLIATAAPAGDDEASITMNLAGGTYDVLISGGNEPGLFTDYGSIGEYQIEVNLPVPPNHFTDLGFSLDGTVVPAPTLTGSGYACEGNLVEVFLTGAPAVRTTYMTYGQNAVYQPLFGGTLVPDTGAGGGFLVLSTDVLGEVSVSDNWPAGTSPGATLYIQAWLPDSPHSGYMASNALVITVP